VLIDDGLVRLRVEKVEAGRARCAGRLRRVVSSHKGVNLPGVPIPIPSLTRKGHGRPRARAGARRRLRRPLVRPLGADVRDLRALLEQAGSQAHVIAKIEKAEAVDALVPCSPRPTR
jgi:pyruvate kinase